MTQRRKRSKKWVSWLIIAVLLVGAGVVCYLVYDNYFREKKDEPASLEEKPQKREEEQPGENEPEEKKEEIVEKEKVVQYDGEDPNVSGGITGVITYAGVSGDNLLIRINIDQYLSGGTCSLGLRKDGGTVYAAEAGVIDSASTSTCEGFNVPVAGLGSGRYNIIIYINSGGKSGEISGEVEL